MSFGPMSSNFKNCTEMSRAGTWTTFFIFIKEQSMVAILCFYRFKMSTLSFGISDFSKRMEPEPMNL